MTDPRREFIVSIETECLTAVPDSPEGVCEAINRFLGHLACQSPTLPAHGGVFTTYGKVYPDCGHIELAAIECDSPYTAPLIVERLYLLVAQATSRLAADGVRLVLANNNHSGLLCSGCSTWGSHENYLVDQHPAAFTDEILPFLVTRIYGGAGGVQHPGGRFLAGVRSTCMQTSAGGGTTDGRAIHSLAREEHHMGATPTRYRYHLILGDGHRSQFNLALQLGATALAVKAATSDRQLRREIATLRRDFSPDWVATLCRVNVLSRGDERPCVDPLVLKTQRLYLEGACRWAAHLDEPPDWIPRLLRDWHETLVALETMDRVWLARRLDAFTKYEFYSAVLAGNGTTFAGLGKQPEAFRELALLDQSYHEFCNSESVFSQLERAGAVEHRVGPRVEPGGEPEPYVPEVETRARVRARFICEHRNRSEFIVDWAYIHDIHANRMLRLNDPFSQELGAWLNPPGGDSPFPHHPLRQAILLEEILQCWDRGRFDQAYFLVRRAETGCRSAGMAVPPDLVRYRAWLSARCGFLDGVPLLNSLGNGQDPGLREITDYCRVYRLTGLLPDLEAMEPWIERGQRALESDPAARDDAELAATFRELAATALTRHGRAEEALALLEPALTPDATGPIGVRTRTRLLAALGETQRRLGRRAEARANLQSALHLEQEHGLEGHLAAETLLSLAKCERFRSRALRWLAQAEQIQIRNADRVAHTAALLLETRLRGRAADENRVQVVHYRDRLPALAQCQLLSRILDNWEAWTSGAATEHDTDRFWGL